MMKKILISLFILSLSNVIDCSNGSSAPSVKPHPTPVVADTNLCSIADTNLQNLGCIPKGQPYTKKGKSFTQFCEETQNNGISLNPKCLSTIKSCDQQDVCTNTKTQ